MNKIVFALLLGLLGIGVLFPTLKVALVLAFLKVSLVLFFYMELRHTHVAWKLASIGLVLVIFTGLTIF